jgi:hypothetical protein
MAIHTQQFPNKPRAFPFERREQRVVPFRGGATFRNLRSGVQDRRWFANPDEVCTIKTRVSVPSKSPKVWSGVPATEFVLVLRVPRNVARSIFRETIRPVLTGNFRQHPPATEGTCGGPLGMHLAAYHNRMSVDASRHHEMEWFLCASGALGTNTSFEVSPNWLISLNPSFTERQS